MECNRYWFKNTNEISLDIDGYLIDPLNSYSQLYCDKSFSLEKIIEKQEKICIFLGDSGIGKTTEYSKLINICRLKSPAVFHYNFENYIEYNRFKKLEVDKNIDTEAKDLLYIVIDSIDEHIDNSSEIFDVLIDLCEKVDKEKIRLLLFCRTIYWSYYFEEQLNSIIEGNINKYYLSPLTRKNVEDFIKGKLEYHNAKTLIDTINDKRLHSFAKVPISLDLLTRSVNENIETTRTRIYEIGCEVLCTELNKKKKNSSKQIVNLSNRIKAAEWIAFVIMLSNSNTIFSERSINNEGFGVSISADLINKELEEKDIQDVLKSNLFNSVDNKSYKWTHKSFAEFLCANYMIKNLEDNQIIKLLDHPNVSGRVIPQLREVAAWVIQLKCMPSYTERIVLNDTGIIFLSDLTLYSRDIKLKFIIQLMRSYCGDNYRIIKFRDKLVYKTCAYDGLEDWINKKLDLIDEYFEGEEKSEDRKKILYEIYDFDIREHENYKLYSPEYPILLLLEIGMQCGYERLVNRSLKYAISYYHIGEEIFHLFIKHNTLAQYNEMLDKFYNNTYVTYYGVKRLNSEFIPNLIKYSPKKSDGRATLDLINLYIDEIDDKDFYRVENILKEISPGVILDWVFDYIKIANIKLIKLAINFIFEERIEELDSKRVNSLIMLLAENCELKIESEHFRQWINNETNLIELKSELDNINISFPPFLNENGVTPKASFIKRKIKLASLEDISSICDEILSGNIYRWKDLIKMLLGNSGYEEHIYNMLSWACHPRLGPLEAVSWNKTEDKESIINAAKKYFEEVDMSRVKTSDHHCVMEHEILLYLLVEECETYLENVDGKYFLKWAEEITKLEPKIEFLIRVLYEKAPRKLISIATSEINNKESGTALVECSLRNLKFVWNKDISQMLNSYLVLNEISVNKKNEIFKFLFEMKDEDAIKFTEDILSKTSEDDFLLEMYLLNTLFSKHYSMAFETYKKLSESFRGFTARFIYILNKENQYFNFLKNYTSKEISSLYRNFTKEKDVYFYDYNKKHQQTDGFINSFYADYDFKRLQESILYWLLNGENESKLNELYQLICEFPYDEVLINEWEKKSDKYLALSWKGYGIQNIKEITSEFESDKLKKITPFKVIDDIVFSCVKLQANYKYKKCLENDRNDFIRDLLDAKGYNTCDQTRHGTSQGGKSPGEVDILIKVMDKPYSLIEALNLDCLNKEYIANHINKIYKYDTLGHLFNVILSYVEIADFNGFWNKYVNYIKTHEYPYQVDEIIENCLGYYNYPNLRIASTRLIRNGVQTVLYHICVLMHSSY